MKLPTRHTGLSTTGRGRSLENSGKLANAPPLLFRWDPNYLPPSGQRRFFPTWAQIIPLPLLSRTEQCVSLLFTGPLIFSEKNTYNETSSGGFLAISEQTVTATELLSSSCVQVSRQVGLHMTFVSYLV